MAPNPGQHDRSPQSKLPRNSPSGWIADRNRFAKRYRTEIAASISSVTSTFSAFPLDSVKTRMQTYQYPNFVSCVRHTYQTETLRGFFRGVTAPLASITLVRTISFSGYQKSKYLYSRLWEREFGVNPLTYANTPGTYPTFATATTFGAAGATAGAIISLVACPFEFTKLSAQVSVLMADQHSSSLSEPTLTRSTTAGHISKGTFQTAKDIVKHQGFLGLYTGFKYHFLRDLLGTGIYFMTYESCKQTLTTYRGDNSPSNVATVLFAGGFCGVASWALIYPIDSVKAIYQRNYLKAYRSGVIKEAPKVQFFNRRMYRGLGVSMSRSFLVNSIFFACFESIKKEINALD